MKIRLTLKLQPTITTPEKLPLLKAFRALGLGIRDSKSAAEWLLDHITYSEEVFFVIISAEQFARFQLAIQPRHVERFYEQFHIVTTEILDEESKTIDISEYDYFPLPKD